LEVIKLLIINLALEQYVYLSKKRMISNFYHFAFMLYEVAIWG